MLYSSCGASVFFRAKVKLDLQTTRAVQKRFFKEELPPLESISASAEQLRMAGTRGSRVASFFSRKGKAIHL